MAKRTPSPSQTGKPSVVQSSAPKAPDSTPANAETPTRPSLTTPGYGYPPPGSKLRGLARVTYRNPPGDNLPRPDAARGESPLLPTWQRWQMAQRAKKVPSGHEQ